MDGFKTVLMFLVLFLISNLGFSYGISVSCMMTYDEGGAPSVYESDGCFEQVLSYASFHNQGVECHFAQLQGLREYQEDRISCDLDMKIPLLGKNGHKEVSLGIAAVFDGHGGREASEMASNFLFDYFYLHYAFKMYKLMVQYKGELTMAESKSLLLEVLKEALLSALHDVDVKFTQEAFESNLLSGSTATIILLFDGQILVANVGDSKALLFSDKIQSNQESEALSAVELTKDHHPERDDERDRIESAGGSVVVRGVPRVNGILAMSRSIGDIYLKRYGVIAVPELTGWQPITANDRYLMVASDGIFESLTADDVRDLILGWESHVQGIVSASSLAEFIVNTAYEKGSGDNLSVILIPLREVFQKLHK